MIQNIATTPEQSKRLLACGLDPKSADFIWQEPITTSQKRTGGKILVFRNPNRQIYVGDVPAWSLSRLLSLLPSSITCNNDDEYSEEYDYDLFIYPSMTGKIWNVSYAYTEDGYSDMLYETAQPSIIESVVQMIETLVSHKRKLNTT